MSLSRFVVSVWSWVRAVFWLFKRACWFCQAVSGARAAVRAAFTAEVTSMPAADAPVAACRIWLRSIPDEEDVEANSVFNAEVELIEFAYSLAWAWRASGEL